MKTCCEGKVRPDEFWLQEARPCPEAVPSEPGTAVVAPGLGGHARAVLGPSSERGLTGRVALWPTQC